MTGPFISYSRKDQPFVRRLADALAADGRDSWVDWDDIRPSAEWMRAIRAGIDAAPAVLVVLSPDSVASAVCAQEIDYALAQHKRMVLVLCRDVDPAAVSEPLRKLNWIRALGDDAPEAQLATITAAIDTDLEWVDAHTRLLVRAADWDANGRDASRLLRGADLDQSEQWLLRAAGGPPPDRSPGGPASSSSGNSEPASSSSGNSERGGHDHSPQPTALQTQYVLASGKHRSSQRRRLLVAVGAALVVTAALAVAAFVQSRIAAQQRNTALSRLLAAQSAANITEIDGRRDLALLQAVAARQLDGTAEAQQSLWRALIEMDRVRRFVHGGETLLSVAIDPKGQTIAIGGFKGGLTLYDARTLGPKASIAATSGGGVKALAFSPDGTVLATANQQGITLRDAASGEARRTIEGHRGGTSRIVWRPDGKAIFSAGINDRSVHIHELAVDPVRDPAPAHPPTVLEGRARGVRDIALSPDARTLAIAGDFDSRVRLWDVAERRERAALAGHRGMVRTVAFSADGGLLASAGDDAVVRVWDSATGELRRTLEGATDRVARVAFSADGRWLAAGSNNRSVLLWDLASHAPPERLDAHTNGLIDLAFTPDSASLVSVAFNDTFIVWNLDATPGRPPMRSRVKAHRDDVRAIAVSPDGQRVASGGDDHAIVLWRLADRAELFRLEGHRGPVRTLAFSPDGSVLASGADDDRRIVLWNLATRGRARELDGRGEVTSVAFSPDGKLLASAAENVSSILLWNTASWYVASELKGHDGEAKTLAFSRDGSLLASGGSDQSVRLWNPATASEIGEPLGAGGSVAQVAISPDGALLASSAHWPGDVLLWDLRGRAPPIGISSGAQGGDRRIAFSPDGKTFAHVMGELRLSIVLRRVADQRAAGTLEASATTLAMAFSADGKQLVSGHSNGDLVIWDADVAAWSQRACEIANRNLTREEWVAAVGDALPYRAPCPELPQQR